MTRRILKLASAIGLVLGTGGCQSVASPAIGILASDVSWDGTATRGTIGSREGKACAQSILGLVASGDASIQAAARAGGIQTITDVDHSTKNVFGLIGEYCTIVRGN